MVGDRVTRIALLAVTPLLGVSELIASDLLRVVAAAIAAGASVFAAWRSTSTPRPPRRQETDRERELRAQLELELERLLKVERQLERRRARRRRRAIRNQGSDTDT